MKKIKIVLITLLLGVVGLGAEERKTCIVSYSNGAGASNSLVKDVQTSLENNANSYGNHKVLPRTGLGANDDENEVTGGDTEYQLTPSDYMVLAEFLGAGDRRYSLKCTLRRRNDSEGEIITTAVPQIVEETMSSSDIDSIANKIIRQLYPEIDVNGISLSLYMLNDEATLKWSGSAKSKNSEATKVDFEYKAVCSSYKDDILNLESAKSLATKNSDGWKKPHEDFTQDFDATLLDGRSQYYFGVVVRDSLGSYACSSCAGSCLKK